MRQESGGGGICCSFMLVLNGLESEVGLSGRPLSLVRGRGAEWWGVKHKVLIWEMRRIFP